MLIEDDLLHCANVGDSKALLLIDSKINALTLKRGLDHLSMLSKTQVLTTCHTPDQPREKVRIIKNRGEIRLHQ